MIRVIIFSLLVTFLSADNPKIYSALGDIIYNNVLKIQNLQTISQYSQYKENINNYILKVKNAKKIGYAIELGDTTIDKKEYLNIIRKLSKTNDFFQRTTINFFKESIKKQNDQLFLQTLNSGLIDTKKYKADIFEYYFSNSNNIKTCDILQNMIDEDKLLKQKQKLAKKNQLTKKQIQEAKIKRLRANDEAKQETLQKQLEEKLLRKKSQIRKEQLEELEIISK